MIIRSVLAGLVLAMTSPAAAIADHHGKKVGELGLQLYSLRNQFKEDVPGTLKIIHDWGITKIEGGGTYGLPMEEFQQLLTKNNLDVVSVGSGFEDLENNVEEVIARAKDNLLSEKLKRLVKDEVYPHRVPGTGISR